MAFFDRGAAGRRTATGVEWRLFISACFSAAIETVGGLVETEAAIAGETATAVATAVETEATTCPGGACCAARGFY